MGTDLLLLITGELLDERTEFTLAELCRTCRVPAEVVLELVEAGVVEPRGREPALWRFEAMSVRRLHCALRLERDLGVNPAGAALALDLLEEIAELRARLRRSGA